MNAAQHMAAVLDAVQGALDKPRREPKPDRTMRVLFEVELDVPCYVALEPGDGPMVTLADVSTWRVVRPTDALELAIREDITEQLVEEDRQSELFGDGPEYSPEDELDRREARDRLYARMFP